MVWPGFFASHKTTSVSALAATGVRARGQHASNTHCIEFSVLLLLLYRFKITVIHTERPHLQLLKDACDAFIFYYNHRGGYYRRKQPFEVDLEKLLLFISLARFRPAALISTPWLASQLIVLETSRTSDWSRYTPLAHSFLFSESGCIVFFCCCFF